MTSTNRLLNRGVLIVVALLLLASAGWIANRFFGLIDIARLGELSVAVLWAIASGCVVLIALAIGVIVTRGRGQVRTLATARDDEGAGSIEARVAADLVADDLARVPEIVDVTARAFLVRGSVVLELGVTTRRAADVRLVVDSVGRAVAALDEVLDSRIPVLLHVASGVRANLAREQRVR